MEKLLPRKFKKKKLASLYETARHATVPLI